MSDCTNHSRRAWLGAAGGLAASLWLSGCAFAQPRPAGPVLLRLPVRPRHFVLASPPRVVLDLVDTPLDAVRVALAQTTLAQHAAVRAVRLAQHDPRTVRLVLDLESEMPVRLHELKSAGGHWVGEMVLGAEPGQGAAAHAAARPRVIALDPGHGGQDPGAVGPGGTHEKAVVLAIAQRLAECLRDRGHTVVLTRERDVFVPLRRRVAVARDASAELFVSVHADAWTDRAVRGASVFALSETGASSELARLLAQTENAADRHTPFAAVGDPHLAHTLLDLTQAATREDSLRLGQAVLGALREATTLRKPYVERAGFAVLKAPDIPSILVETGFISNPREERLLRRARHQEKLAAALARALDRFEA